VHFKAPHNLTHMSKINSPMNERTYII